MGRRVSSGINPGGFGFNFFDDNTLRSVEVDSNLRLDADGTGIIQSLKDFEILAASNLRFADSDSSNYIGFKAPDTVTADLIWTLPATDGTEAQLLSTDGSGTLSWANPGVTITDNNDDAATHYLTITPTSSGGISDARISTTKLSFQPSTGSLSLGGGTASTSTTTGTIIVTGGIGLSGALYAGADVVAYASSDIRLKENVSKIDNSLEKLSKISGYQYYWNSVAKEMYPERTELDVGVIAQEVQEALPSAVVEREDGYLAVNYDKIIPLLIESIKILKEELDTIKGGAE